MPADSSIIPNDGERGGAPENHVSGNGVLRLNIGGGRTSIEGFTLIDRIVGKEAFPLEYPDASVDEIRASHILEHFSFSDAGKAINEWSRVLKPGGRMRIAVPDFDRIMWLSRIDPQWHLYLMGGQENPDEFHKSCWTVSSLSDLMRRAGLEDIRPWPGDNNDCSTLPCSLNLEGIRNGADIKTATQIRIAAVMSIPRVGWNDNWGHTWEALSPFHIPIRRFNGVYWGQCMQRAFNDCMLDNLDWILTIDYDTLFTAKHLGRMLEHMATHPEIDALAALQARRGQPFPLVTIQGEQQIGVAAAPVKVTTAHFGLTLIRVSALKEVPKPWFFSRPDPQSEWGDLRLDDDIWFWHQWRLAGKSVYMASDVSIGHLELMVSEFDLQNGKHQHIYVEDWRKQNCNERRPLECSSDSSGSGDSTHPVAQENCPAASPTC